MSDSDVNDPSAPYLSNDSLSLAQAIPNPASLGGYVNKAKTGYTGRSYEQGDSNDFYITQLFAGQTVTLNVADFGPDTNNLAALFLLDVNGSVVRQTTGAQQFQSLSITRDGLYYLQVTALTGASNYLLTIGTSGTNATTSNTYSNKPLDFVPGEVIVEFHPDKITDTSGPTGATRLDTKNSVTISSEAIRKATGLELKAGGRGRAMLLSIPSHDTPDILSKLGSRSAGVSPNPDRQKRLDTIAAIETLRKRDDVLSARLNYIRRPLMLPNDSFYSYQWHYPQIKLPQAWDISVGENTIVAVVDTGVVPAHPDLSGQLLAGFDFIRDPRNAGDGDGIDNNPEDIGDNPDGNGSFHGSHVSGTIAAATNNFQGIAGVAGGAKIMPLRALGIFGGTDYDVEQAIRYAAGLPNDSGSLPARKADVINLSLGGPGNTTFPPQAYRLARQAGLIIVAASGNESYSGLTLPASLDGVVSVSATTITGALAPYSNFGNTIDIAAPGGSFSDNNLDGYVDGVLSTTANDNTNPMSFNYSFYQGTSMAAPHVAGVAALMKSVNQDLTPEQFDELLSAGQLTDDIGATGKDNLFGYGQINALKAVTAAKNLTDPAAPPEPAFAEALPSSLNFGAFNTSMDLLINNTGEAKLQILAIDTNADNWLTIRPVAVNDAGLGRYNVAVNRQALQEETRVYSAYISVQTNINRLLIPVLMQVYVSDIPANAGHQHVILRDMQTRQKISKATVQFINGSYHFEFQEVQPGTYFISAGTDSDNDGIVCEPSEACGSYHMPAYSTPLVIDTTTRIKSNINFETSYGNVLNSRTVNPSASHLMQHIDG